MFTEDRDAPRERIALPLKIGDGLMAVTRDIGPSGMYVEIKGKHELTGKLVFELQLPGLKFTAEGEILRIDHLPGSTGLAIKFHESRLESRSLALSPTANPSSSRAMSQEWHRDPE